MTPDAAFALEIAAVVGLAALVVAIVAAAAGACERAAAGAGRAAVHDVERALGPATLMTYDQARAAASKKGREASMPSAKGREEEAPWCALCLTEYAGSDELVRVLPACGHFFHAECSIDRWLQERGTCPICRAGLRPPPKAMLPRSECPPMPPRPGGATVGQSGHLITVRLG